MYTTNNHLFGCTIIQDILINTVVNIFHFDVTITGIGHEGVKSLRLNLTEHSPGGVIVPRLFTIKINFELFREFSVINVWNMNLLEGYFHVLTVKYKKCYVMIL